jgi:hypothetical protein
MAKTTKQAADLVAHVHTVELTLRVPGLEVLAAQMAQHELAKETGTSYRDNAIRSRELQLEGERLALQRAELEQRIREWELDKKEREARLAARGKDLGL